MTGSLLERFGFLALGAVLTWFFQQYRVAKSEEAIILGECIKDYERLIEALQDYWLKQPANDTEERAAAAKVRARLSATNFMYPRVLEICGARRDEFQDKSLELFTVGTGGEFESANRKADPELAIEVYVVYSELVHILRLARRDLSTLRRLSIDAWKGCKLCMVNGISWWNKTWAREKIE